MKNIGKKFFLLFVCLLLAFLVSDILLCMVAVGMYLFKWGEGCMRILILATYGLSAGAAGYFAGHREEKYGFLYGALEGLVYFLAVLLISLIFGNGVQGVGGIMGVLAITVLGGALGSLVPYRKKKR